LTGALETCSQNAKEALQNNTLDLTKITMIGTRKRRLNTKIEPSYENSKKLNVDEVTILGTFDKKILSQIMRSDNVYHRIVYIMKQATQEYYNMGIVLGLKCN